MGGPVFAPIPEAVAPIAVEAVEIPDSVEAVVVESDAEAIPEAVAVEAVEADAPIQLAIATDAESDEDAEAVEDEDGWISSQEFADLLTAQGVKPPSLRTLQHWAKDSEGTKEGFSPAYTAKKIKGKLMWKPA